MGEDERLCITNGPIVGVDTSGDIIFADNTSYSTTSKLRATDTQDLAVVELEADAVSVNYGPIVDMLMRETHESSQRTTNLFSEETTAQLSKDVSMALKRAKRKHYKPNFTL